MANGLTKITIDIENDPYLGGIRIKSTANVSSIVGFDAITIRGREAVGITEDTSKWISEIKIEVENVSSLNFEMLDILTASKKYYDYVISIMNGDSVVEYQVYSNIECWFEGLFIGDFNTQYIAGTNFSCDSQCNTQVAYVNTLSGKYPYRVSNADTNYDSGSASGLFLKLTQDKRKFIPDYDHTYSDNIVNFLSDGRDKLLKTHDGQIWLVSIDETITRPFNEHFTGKNDISFNWTEIGEVPTSGMVVLA